MPQNRKRTKPQSAKLPQRRPSRDLIGIPKPKPQSESQPSAPSQRIGAQRQLTHSVKTARGRSNSSAQWLNRQINDPYVAEAQRMGYRSRAAFKIAELDDRFGFFKRAKGVVDLGCAPGGWLQVAEQRCSAETAIVGIDLQEVEPIGRCHILIGDMLDEASQAQVIEAAGQGIDVVMSDMAAPSIGHAQTDHLRVMMLIDTAFDVAEKLLIPGGYFIAKVLQGGAQKSTLDRLKKAFTKVQQVKPPASRSDSREQFIVAQGFRG